MPRYRLDDELTVCPGCRSQAIRHLDFVPAKRLKHEGKFLHFITGCEDCGTIFVNPLPTAEAVEQYYAPGGTWLQDKKWEAPDVEQTPERIAKELAAAEFRKQNRITITHLSHELFGRTEGVRLFDFGCGRGRMLDDLKPLGFELTGLDPATQHMLTRHRMIREIPDRPAFDAIISVHVLEHLPDPLRTLRQFRSAMGLKGFLFLGMPCLLELQEHRQKRYVMNERQHLTGYTPRSLSTMLARAGFRMVQWYKLSIPYRMHLAAVVDDHAAAPDDPLAEAEESFRRFRETEPDWDPAWAGKPVASLAYVQNKRLAKKASKLRAQSLTR